ncbi:MAG: hypothetical protein ACYCTB_10455 [bacterium]
MLNYFALIFININPFFGGRLLAVSYITIANLNPVLSMLVIIISDITICILGFYFAQYLRKFNFINKRLSKMNDNGKWIEHGAYIGFFVGQLFIGTFFISLILGLIQNRKNDILYFYVPLITSIIFYTIIYYSLSVHGINLMKDWL